MEITFEMYEQKVKEYEEKVKATTDDDEMDQLLDEIFEYKYEFMSNKIEEFRNKACFPAQRAILGLLNEVVDGSTTGIVSRVVDNKEFADDIADHMIEDVGKYLLNYEVIESKGLYKGENTWVIICKFDPKYVPDWNGWEELVA